MGLYLKVQLGQSGVVRNQLPEMAVWAVQMARPADVIRGWATGNSGQGCWRRGLCLPFYNVWSVSCWSVSCQSEPCLPDRCAG